MIYQYISVKLTSGGSFCSNTHTFMFPIDLMLFQAFTKPKTHLNFQTSPDFIEFVPITSFFLLHIHQLMLNNEDNQSKVLLSGY